MMMALSSSHDWVNSQATVTVYLASGSDPYALNVDSGGASCASDVSTTDTFWHTGTYDASDGTANTPVTNAIECNPEASTGRQPSCPRIHADETPLCPPCPSASLSPSRARFRQNGVCWVHRRHPKLRSHMPRGARREQGYLTAVDSEAVQRSCTCSTPTLSKCKKACRKIESGIVGQKKNLAIADCKLCRCPFAAGNQFITVD